MVFEAEDISAGGQSHGAGALESARKALLQKDGPGEYEQREGGTMAMRIPPRPKPERLPLKHSFNEEDGYLDVSLSATQSWSSSLASSFASFRTPAAPILSSSFEHVSPHGSSMSDTTRQSAVPLIDVAGWLKTYQPNFALQAVRPYGNVFKEIKASMLAEAKLAPLSHPSSNASPNEWTELSVTLVADTTTFTIERIRLLQRRKPELPNVPVDEELFPYEEKLLVEPVMDLDATLIDAVERLLAQSGGSSRTESRATSRAPSPAMTEHRSECNQHNLGPVNDQRASEPGDALHSAMGIHAHVGAENAQRHCKRIVLGALQEVIRSVLQEKEEDEVGHPSSTRRRREPDSTLREGVRKWFAEMDDGM